MILYSGAGPSARTVRIFLAEKGLMIETIEVDLMRGEHLKEPYIQLNPEGQYPVLQLDDGILLGESLAICEYLDECYPSLPLVGATAEQRAQTRMWCRRLDLRIMEPGIQAFKATLGYEFFKDRYFLVRQGADELAALSTHNKRWLDRHMEGKDYICGDRFSLADIQLWCFMSSQAAQGVPEGCGRLDNWYKRVAGRPNVAGTS